MTLVVVDADVLGRHRTGDETYVLNLLRAMPGPAAEAGLRIAAVTRHPDLVPEGIEPVALPARSQALRMAWSLPRLLRRLGADLVHTQYALPARCPCPAVVTIHDLSFEADPTTMPPRMRRIFRRVVPRAARDAARVLTVSARTRDDLVALYGVDPARIVLTPNAVDPVFTPGPATGSGYVLTVGAVQERKNQRLALAAAREVGLGLVVAGPTKEQHVADELRADGARLEGYVTTERLVDLYRGAACVVLSSRFEGFGVPVLEAMACGTPVVIVDEPALVEVAGGAAVVTTADGLADGVRRALAERATLAAAGLARAGSFSWEASAREAVRAYQEALAA